MWVQTWRKGPLTGKTDDNPLELRTPMYPIFRQAIYILNFEQPGILERRRCGGEHRERTGRWGPESRSHKASDKIYSSKLEMEPIRWYSIFSFSETLESHTAEQRTSESWWWNHAFICILSAKYNKSFQQRLPHVLQCTRSKIVAKKTDFNIVPSCLAWWSSLIDDDKVVSEWLGVSTINQI